MRVVVLALLLTVCVSAGLLDFSKSKAINGKITEFFGEKLSAKLKKTLDSMKKVFNTTKLLAIRDKIHGLKDKMMAKLTLNREQMAALIERLKLFKRTKIDHVQPQGDSINEINMNSEIANVLFQGDIVLTESQAEEVVNDVEEGNRTKRQAYRDRRYPQTTWSNGVSYYFYSNANAAVRSVFRKGADLWMRDTCIDFVESSKAPDRIRVFMEDGCWSYVGRRGGEQDLSLGSGCESVETAAHELGHALGFFHTQSRHDRDHYITVNVRNIKPDWVDQFTKETIDTNENYGIPYDYGSIMHYGALSATFNKKPTMIPHDALYTETLGSPFISFYELLMLNTHYKCLSNCNGRPSADCQMGGFPHPRDCQRCICPSGYGGVLCNRRPAGCGSELIATSSWTKFEDMVGDKAAGQSPREDFMKCNYWIMAPKGRKIQVKFVGFSEGIAVDGCTYGGVEIKTHKDQRLSGYRFCSKEDANTILTSSSNIVPIITYNRIYATITRLEYRYI